MNQFRNILGIGLLASGYALLYYGVDVLMWAHASTSTADPVTIGQCFGLPGTDARSNGAFAPPLTLGAQIPGAITDARGLMGGIPTTGTYATAQITASVGGGAVTPAPGSPPVTLSGPSGGAASNLPAPTSAPAVSGTFGTPASGNTGATGVYVQNGYQQNADGTWTKIQTNFHGGL